MKDERVTMKPSCPDWANAIGEAIFSADKAGQVVYLAVDEEEIGEIGQTFGLDSEAAYESFREAVIAEVSSGWSFPDRDLRAGEFPVYFAVLAAQVVAASQMHVGEDASSNAYWRRLREFLVQSGDDLMPYGLTADQHQKLWKRLKLWANETHGGRLGLVKLVEKGPRERRHVAEPIGQCLLRRADLERLRLLFAERGRPDPEPYRGRRLRELVDDACTYYTAQYFTPHGVRVLKDENRFDAAWGQIEADYERFLHEECPKTVPSPKLERRPRAATTVRLQIVRGKLTGGLYRRGDGPLQAVNKDISDVLWRCYQRTGRDGSTPPHKPPHDKFLLAVRPDEFAAFEERDRCRAGDDVLMLFPEHSERAWIDDADPRLFVDEPEHYRPTIGVDRAGWFPLAGLPLRWLALRFKLRDDISDVELNGKWIEIVVDRHTTRLRFEGGLLLKRNVWMRGAGPTVRVVGPGSFDHILIDDKPYPLDASRCATPNLGVGSHRIRLPIGDDPGLRLRVREARRAKPGEWVGWRWAEGEWPASFAERRRIAMVPGSATLYGPRLAGDWPARRATESVPDVPTPRTPNEAIPDALAVMILAVHLRSGGRVGARDPRLIAASAAANPLLRAMYRAGHPVIPAGMDEA